MNLRNVECALGESERKREREGEREIEAMGE